MRRGTTPTLTIKLLDVDVKDFGSIYVTLKQGSIELTKTNLEIGIDEENNAVSVPFTQDETLMFNRGSVDVQLRVLLKDNVTAIASKIKSFSMERILKDGVISEVE